MRRARIELDETVALIVLAAAILILVIFWTRTQMGIDKMKEVEACRLSVTAYAKGWVEAGPIDTHLFDIDCTRRVVTFAEDEVEMNGKTLRFWDPAREEMRKGYAELTPEIVNSVAASEMAICWYQFLEGKSYWDNEKIEWGNNNRACFICSELRFAPGADGYAGEPLVEFLKEETSTPYPQRLEEREPTYFEYFYGQERLCDHEAKWYEQRPDPEMSCEEAFYAYITKEELDSHWEKRLLDESLVIDPSQSYYVLLFQYGRDKGEKEGQSTGTTYAPVLIPSTNFDTKLCEIFIG